MQDFDAIYRIAADRQGGADALEARLTRPVPAAELAEVPADRWLAAMAKCLFQAGFNWSVIEKKWPGFEAAFDGFDVARVAFYHDGDMDRLLADKGIVRNAAKISAVVANARFLQDLAQEHGSAGAAFANWPNADYVDLLQLIAKQGSRLGAVTGQRMLRSMGRDSFILSPDVTARLIAEGVVDRPPSAQRDMKAVQDAFNTWSAQSGRGLTAISQTLAFSIDHASA
ncbi:MAG: 3-methyladenine DNA glycosylase [Minwuia thermotolerans]|nr:MAG: 3-methyladenine DNA glycosylase [Minwuia thermotolerans]